MWNEYKPAIYKIFCVLMIFIFIVSFVGVLVDVCYNQLDFVGKMLVVYCIICSFVYLVKPPFLYLKK